MKKVLGATDRRQARGYRLALPIAFDHGTGLTRDISASGTFFETDASFSVGMTINCSLVLEYADPSGPLRLHCHGEVRRVERRKGKVGVAVRFTSYWLDRTEHAGTSPGRSKGFPAFPSSPGSLSTDSHRIKRGARP